MRYEINIDFYTSNFSSVPTTSSRESIHGGQPTESSPAKNKMQYVCNPAGILSQAACDSIDSMLYALEQQTGIETVVA